MRDALVSFLGLSKPPDDFLLVTEPQVSLERLLEEVKPRLVVIDSVRAHRPDVTEKNKAAAEWLKELRRLSRKYNCAFVLVHHLRKPGENSFRYLGEETRVVEWLLEMEGPRTFVNQTDVRVAVADGDDNPAALKVKWSRRVHGDSPLALVERVFEQGEPAGYRPLTGRDFLSTQQQQALDKLPNDAEWSFKEAKLALGEALAVPEASAKPAPDNRTNEFLQKSRHHRLIERLGRNRYRKTATPTQVPAPPDATLDGGVAGVPNEASDNQVDKAARA
jgi:hypothetical protein